MEENKQNKDVKEIKISIVTLICIILIVILVAVIGIMFYHYNYGVPTRNNTVGNTDTFTEQNDVLDSSTIIESPEVGQEINFDSEEVQRIFPYTGAYPSIEYRYLYKLDSVNSQNISNDFILRLAFAKVTKEDWADSYVSEGEPLSISTSLFDQYVKEIFGNTSYSQKSFHNKDLKTREDEPFGSYYNTFSNNNLSISFDIGDVGSDTVLIMNKKAIQYSDRIELILYPIILKFEDKLDHNDSWLYSAYTRYNYDTKTYEGNLKSNITENANLSDIPISNLDEIKLVYKYDSAKKDYYFSELVKNKSTSKTSATLTESTAVGTWNITSATKNGNEISLQDIYGTGIQYGGSLKLNSNRTFSKYVGITDETSNEGTYRIDNNYVYCTYADNRKEQFEYISDYSGKEALKLTYTSGNETISEYFMK